MSSAQAAWQRKQNRKGNCGTCGREIFRAARCWRHYVLRYCMRNGIGTQLWFVCHELEFIDTLRGRFKALSAGEEVADEDTFIMLFQRGGPVQLWADGKPVKSRIGDKLHQMLKHFDRLAREHGEGSVTDSNGTDGEGLGGSTPERGDVPQGVHHDGPTDAAPGSVG